MRQRRPYDDQGDNLPFNGVDPDNLPYSMHTDYRGMNARGRVFLAILGFGLGFILDCGSSLST